MSFKSKVLILCFCMFTIQYTYAEDMDASSITTYSISENTNSYQDMQKSYLDFVAKQPKEQQEKLRKSFEIIMISSTLLGADADKPENISKKTISEFVRLTNGKSVDQINALYKKLADETMIEVFYDMMKESNKNNSIEAKKLEDKLFQHSENKAKQKSSLPE